MGKKKRKPKAAKFNYQEKLIDAAINFLIGLLLLAIDKLLK